MVRVLARVVVDFEGGGLECGSDLGSCSSALEERGKRIGGGEGEREGEREGGVYFESYGVFDGGGGHGGDESGEKEWATA